MDIHDTLYTKRLRIVPLDQEHFAARKAAAAAAAAHDEQAQNLYDAMQELPERATADDAAHFWWYTNREIYLHETNEYLGSIALMSAPDTDPEHLVEVGYSLCRMHGEMVICVRHWGRFVIWYLQLAVHKWRE